MELKKIKDKIEHHQEEVRFHRSEIVRYKKMLEEYQQIPKGKVKEKEILFRQRLIEMDKLSLLLLLMDKSPVQIAEAVKYLNAQPRDPQARNYDLDSFRNYFLPKLAEDSRFIISRLSETGRAKILIHKREEE